MSGPDTGSPPSGPKLDRFLAYWDNAVEAVCDRLRNAVLSGDRVAHSDASTSIADLRIAHHLAHGRTVGELDRDGWPVTR